MNPKRRPGSICSVQRLRSRPLQLAAAGVLAVVLAGGGWLAFNGRAVPSPTPSPIVTPSPSPSPTPSPSPSPSPTPEPVACPLNGLPVDDEALLENTAITVQIDNHPGARPGRGLNSADMVVEATVEGDTTRFTGVYLCRHTVGLTGPVRSARYYNVDLWQDLGVLTIGFGASWETLDRFAAFGMPYADGITGRWPWFQRVRNGRLAPHNLYGDVEKIRQAFGQNAALDGLAERVGPLRPPFTFDPGAIIPDGRAVSALEIRTNAYWRIGWRWDRTLDAWRRVDGGVDTVDEVDGQPVTATSVVVQRVTEEIVYNDPDPGGNPRRLHSPGRAGGCGPS
jgi:hypothetical protein